MTPLRDAAYRRFLRGKYTKQGFGVFRMYIDANGNSFVSIACYYCGDMAQTEDHAFPLVALYTVLSAGDTVATERLITVPACFDCNRRLHDKVFPSLQARKHHIKQALRKRFAKELRMPIWHLDELEALGPTLRSAIERGIALQHKIKERLAW